jgi:hypothetical protein
VRHVQVTIQFSTLEHLKETVEALEEAVNASSTTLERAERLRTLYIEYKTCLESQQNGL